MKKSPHVFFAVVPKHLMRVEKFAWRKAGPVWYFLHLPHVWAFCTRTWCLPACRACLSLCFAPDKTDAWEISQMCGAGSAPLALTMMRDDGPCLGNLVRVSYFRTDIRHSTRRRGSFNNSSVFVFGEMRHLATKEEGLRFSTKAFL
jgi:hypothetical protein